MENDVKDLVVRISFEVVKDVAPDEIDLYDDIKEEFFKNPDAFLKKEKKQKEKMLGFAGVAGAEQFITLAVLPVVLNIVKYVGSAGVESIKKEGAKFVAKKIEEKFDARKESRIPKEKIMEFRKQAFENAKAAGLDDAKAAMIADSSIGKMTLMGLL